jgi:hypothetical protein
MQITMACVAAGSFLASFKAMTELPRVVSTFYTLAFLAMGIISAVLLAMMMGMS